MATEGRPPRRRGAKKKQGAKGPKPAAKRAPAPPPTPEQAKLSDDSAAERAGFTPRTLDRSVIAIPLLRAIAEEQRAGQRVLHHVVIDLNLEFRGGRDRA